jgi:hypothetical protein
LRCKNYLFNNKIHEKMKTKKIWVKPTLEKVEILGLLDWMGDFMRVSQDGMENG